jgi:predicted metallo-beta-lactamase superfamily hydrolase
VEPMRIKILAADSMGVRSLATVVETSDARIAIDLGASLAPRRYGLPPHEVEYERLESMLGVIREELADSDVAVITHYHYDHYLPHPDDAELYRGKLLLVKDPRHNINRSQAIRSWRFLKVNGVQEKASRVISADGASIELGETRLLFSPPVPHGEPGTKLGNVLMLLIVEGDTRLAFTSDVQGPIDDNALSILLRWRPTHIILGGPPTYFAGYKVSRDAVEHGLYNMSKLSRLPSLRCMVVDHHLLRDLGYRSYIERYTTGSSGRICTAAEYMGVPVQQLEARRRELWGK